MTAARPPLRLAVWQQPGVCGQPEAMIDRLDVLLASGALAATDLLLLPELWTSGYFDAEAVAPATMAWPSRLVIPNWQTAIVITRRG